MAGEVKGKVYEAITKVALEIAIRGNRRGWKVLWHEQPDWISIEADLAIGSDKNNIDALLLVTHSRSEKLSEKKFWRNFGEVFQWKVQGPKAVRVFSVVFDAAIKPGLRSVEEAVIDASLKTANTRYGKKLIRYVAKDESVFGRTDVQREQIVRDLIDPKSGMHDPELAQCVTEFAEDLRNLLKQPAKPIEQAWNLLRTIDGREFQKSDAKNTYIRNGIAKLMLADKTARMHLYDAVETYKPIEHEVLPKYTIDLGLVTEEIEGCYVKDPEMQSAIQMLGRKDCEAVIAKVPARMDDFIDPLRSIGNIELYSQFVVDNFDELKTASGMKKWLKACYDDPVEIVGDASLFDVPPRDCWLFVYGITLEKALQKKVVAYGLSSLAHDSGVPDAELRFAMPEFVARKALPAAATLTAVARVLAGKLANIGMSKLRSVEFQKSMRDMLTQRQMYVLSTYRNFDPIAWLIQLKLEAIGITAGESTVPSFLKELADASSATSTFIRPRSDTLIYWQSCHGSHVNDKTKELSARFRATKVAWDGVHFKERASAKHLFFVADGEWRDEDLEMLSRSGATEIFYPDGVDKLAMKIKELNDS